MKQPRKRLLSGEKQKQKKIAQKNTKTYKKVELAANVTVNPQLVPTNSNALTGGMFILPIAIPSSHMQMPIRFRNFLVLSTGNRINNNPVTNQQPASSTKKEDEGISPQVGIQMTPIEQPQYHGTCKQLNESTQTSTTLNNKQRNNVQIPLVETLSQPPFGTPTRQITDYSWMIHNKQQNFLQTQRNNLKESIINRDQNCQDDNKNNIPGISNSIISFDLSIPKSQCISMPMEKNIPLIYENVTPPPSVVHFDNAAEERMSVNYQFDSESGTQLVQKRQSAWKLHQPQTNSGLTKQKHSSIRKSRYQMFLKYRIVIKTDNSTERGLVT
ncbi:unnamed protein product [Didymodactylos carnosus]|uniref:Uncharacterized protein n=1 Tax=Didymodactylos carnosus TaxID=1234261 RepID=A0A815F1Q5_9BILA|nr:unnamed protein product [Didymodactylos carnosus]CAF4165002.1 unnamed protein product [Didymodactylos carnosus]